MTSERVVAVDEEGPGGLNITPGMTPSEKADALEERQLGQLNRRVAKSVLFTSGELDPTQPAPPPDDPNQLVLMGDDPRLPKMPPRPTLLDFFKYRLSPSQNHLLQ